MTDEGEYWQAILSRDKGQDGKFVFAVESTGIYCRPSCPARRPKRERVRFFALPADAERDGFRACKRCQPDRRVPHEPRLEAIRQMCQYLADATDHKVTLEELGRHFNLSPYHLQRTFKRLVGVTPRQFAETRRLERFKEHLKRRVSVTDAMYDAGYQSSSGAYRETAGRLGMTPNSYRRGGGEGEYPIQHNTIPVRLASGCLDGARYLRGQDGRLGSGVGERPPSRPACIEYSSG